MNSLIIAGGGKFGKKAIAFAKKKDYKTILIDNNPHCFCASYATRIFKNFNDFNLEIEKIKPGQIFFLNYDVSVLFDIIFKINPEFIIPVIPIHLMANLIYKFLKLNLLSDTNSTKEFVNNTKSELILNYNLEQGVVYLSYAKIDEICPDNCFGPLNYCPNFKRRKLVTITEYLKNYFKIVDHFIIRKNDKLKVIIIFESYQLTAGLGGIKGIDLLSSLNKLRKNLNELLNQEFKLIIATTCNCHGVINFYKKQT